MPTKPPRPRCTRTCATPASTSSTRADEYSKGKSEEILGRLIKGHRDELVIATKCNSQQATRRQRARHVAPPRRAGGRREPEAPAAPIASMSCSCTATTRSRRSRSRCARSRTWCARARCSIPPSATGRRGRPSARLDIQERNNWARLQVVQPMYSLVKRQAEVEILPMAEANGIGVIPYSPAAAGPAVGQVSRPGAAGRLQDQQDVRGALRRRLDVRGGRGISSPSARSAACTRSARRSPGSARIPR